MLTEKERPLVTEAQYKALGKFRRYLVDHGRFMIVMDRESEREYLHRYYPFYPESRHRKNKDIDANIFLHQFMLSDDPVFHDHPWNWYRSIIVKGGYWEHTPWGTFWRGVGHTRYVDCERYRRVNDDPDAPFIPANLHWVEIIKPGDTWTVFMRGRETHDWGFVPKPYTGEWIQHDEYLEMMKRQKGCTSKSTT